MKVDLAATEIIDGHIGYFSRNFNTAVKGDDGSIESLEKEPAQLFYSCM